MQGVLNSPTMHSRAPWRLDDRKFLTTPEAERLRASARQVAVAGHLPAVVSWMLIDLGLAAGLRVAELAALRLSDVVIEGGRRSVIVRRGKGDKRRSVQVGPSLVVHLRAFLTWRTAAGYPQHPEAPLFWSPRYRRHYSRRFLQKLFKDAAHAAGLPAHLSIHCLRHTYAIHLYKASRYNLRLVQKQLGHSSVSVTQVYADVFDEDLFAAVENLYPSTDSLGGVR